MNRLEHFILKGIRQLSIMLAVNSLYQASTLFTYQPTMDDTLKKELMDF